MKVTVVGYLACDFQDKDGKQVQGVSLKVIKDSNKDGFVGKDIMKVWLPKSIVDSVGFVPDVGSDVELIYDFDGRNSILIGYKLIEPTEYTADNSLHVQGKEMNPIEKAFAAVNAE